MKSLLYIPKFNHSSGVINEFRGTGNLISLFCTRFVATKQSFLFPKKEKRRNKETFWTERSSEKGTKGDDPTRFRGETVPLGEKKGKEIYTRGENQRRAKSRKTETKTWIPFKRENNSGTGESRHPPWNSRGWSRGHLRNIFDEVGRGRSFRG